MDILEELTRTRSRSTSGRYGDYKCPICHDTGWAVRKETGYAYECGCGLLKRERLEGRLKFAGIPKRYEGLGFKDFDTGLYTEGRPRELARHALDVARYYVSNYGGLDGLGLYLCSEAKGTGKTRLAAIIANELIRKGVGVKFATSVRIIGEIRGTWESGGEGTLLNDLAEAEVLVVDDFGTEAVKDWVGERFYDIINRRYEGRKATVYTSNASISKLPYGERIKGRVREDAQELFFPEEGVRRSLAERREAILNMKVRESDGQGQGNGV